MRTTQDATGPTGANDAGCKSEMNDAQWSHQGTMSPSTRHEGHTTPSWSPNQASAASREGKPYQRDMRTDAAQGKVFMPNTRAQPATRDRPWRKS